MLKRLDQEYEQFQNDKIFLITAINKKDVYLLELMLLNPLVDIAYNDAIISASTCGALAIVDRLLQDERVDPAACYDEAIINAATYGHLDVVDRLLQDKRVDPAADDNSAIIEAAKYGHLATLDRLLQDPRVDPAAEDNSAIGVASKKWTSCCGGSPLTGSACESSNEG